MEIKHLTMAVISSVIMVVMVTAVLIPTIEGAEDNKYSTYENSAGIYASELDLDGTHTISLSVSEKKLTVDGTIITVTDWAPVIAADTLCVRGYQYPTNVVLGTTTSSTSSEAATYWGGSASSITVQITDGVGTITVGSTTRYIAFDWFYYANPAGDHKMIYSSGSTSVNVGSLEDLHVSWYNNTDGVQYNAVGTTVTSSDGSTATATFAATEVKEGLFTGTVGESGSWSFEKSGKIYKANLTVVPDKVVLVDSNPVYPLISTIPILVLVGLVLGVIGAFISRRD